MDAKSAALAYRAASLENAPPIKIVRMLYEGAIRFLDRAKTARDQEILVRFTHWLARADAIVDELRCGLDHSHDARMSGQLDQLYLYVQDQIAQAIVNRDPAPIEAARRVLATLLEGWIEVEFATTARDVG